MSERLPEGTVTILFTDVEESTDLRTRVGDRAAQESSASTSSWCARPSRSTGGAR